MAWRYYVLCIVSQDDELGILIDPILNADTR